MATRRTSSRLGLSGAGVKKEDENAHASLRTGTLAGKRGIGVAGADKKIAKVASSASVASAATVSTGIGGTNPRKRILNDRTNAPKSISTAPSNLPLKKPVVARKASKANLKTEDSEVEDHERPIKGTKKVVSSTATGKVGLTAGVRRGLAVTRGPNGATVRPSGAISSSRPKVVVSERRASLRRAKKVEPEPKEEDEEVEREAKRQRTDPDDEVQTQAEVEAVAIDEEAAYERAVRGFQKQLSQRKAVKLKEGEAGWEDLDEGDEDDPLMVKDYVVEVYDYMRQLELVTLPNPDYMDQQVELTWKMRGILVDWLVEVHSKFRLLPETIFLAVNLVDRFLSVRKVSLLKFQLVGVTALFVAAKYEEVVCPSVTNFLFMTDGGYEVGEILKAEKYMLQMVEWDMSYPNPLNFLRRISKADGYDIQSRTFAKYFMEISIVESKLISSPPSLVAAAATWLSRKVLERGEWDPNLVHYSGYSERELLEPAQKMVDYVIRSGLAAEQAAATPSAEGEGAEHANFHKKYASRKFYRASNVVRDWALTRYAYDTPAGTQVDRLEEWDCYEGNAVHES